ncbi:MAG: hypothetical protein FJ284_05335 [Planctomycetes bacterium]|nr:hypothetical protein [Planctomycetota bacterium]
MAALPVVASAAPRDRPTRSLAILDEEYLAAERDLRRRCEIEGHADLEAIIAAWRLPDTREHQVAFVIPAVVELPSCVDSDGERSIWNDFLAARRARADATFEHALFAARGHARRPTRAELARPGAERPPLEQASCEAVRLLFLVLRDDPDHERARIAAGWVRRGDRWEWPAAARRLDKAETYDPAFGWLGKSKLARHHAGERFLRGRWVTAAEDDTRLREVAHGRQFDADHWEIVSTAPPAVTGAFAASLETTRLIWLQVFGSFSAEPADLERRFAGRGRSPPLPPHSAILCGSRTQYVDELGRLEPRVAVTDGIYWQPTATIWCFADPAAIPVETVRHEGFHQLFAESRPDIVRQRAEPGARVGFWAVEAAALYAESIRATSFGWTVGGRDAGRTPAARQRLVDDDFHVPLAELVALGREAFQASDRLADVYDQSAALADFFMNAAANRYRESFVEYLARVYAGTADTDTLARLCGRSLAELDAEYKDYLREQHLEQVGGR